MYNRNLRIHFLQLRLKLRILFHKADIAFHNLKLLRLYFMCKRVNLLQRLDVFPFFRTRLKVFGKVDDVFDVTHDGDSISSLNVERSHVEERSDSELTTATGSDSAGFKLSIVDENGKTLSWRLMTNPEREDMMVKSIQLLLWDMARDGKLPKTTLSWKVQGEGQYR